ncbi:MAG: hypothetical protein K2X27_26915 [Candidatus Obscuribacterales bacterium]|nr:hypothetical protein [Candidatus Obscuribacterales bacterium]
MENLLTASGRKAESKTQAECEGNGDYGLPSDVWDEIRKAGDKLSSTLNELKANRDLQKLLDSLSPPVKAPDKNRNDWTITIDFTTNFGDGQGVESGLKLLEDFAQKTKGKSLSIVAQAAVPETDEWDDLGPITTANTSYRIDRYIVKNGEMKYIESVPSKGYAEDLKALLQFSHKNEPSKKCALIMDSHGSGNEGLTGDTGKVSVTDFVKAVQDGLKGSGHSKLDMIDFDSCLMAQNGALSRIRQLSDQIVASAQTESIYNGQNYLDPIARLMDKPDSDGFTLARDIVAQTHKDMELWKFDGYDPAVETLAHFNMKRYEGFQKSLDELGEQLVTTIDDPKSRSVVESAIDSSRKYGRRNSLMGLLLGDSKSGQVRVDLKEFSEKLITAVDCGEIKDPERTLKAAAQDVLTMRSRLVDSYHGDGDYTHAGGLSVFLPSRHLRNIEKEAEQNTSAGRIKEISSAKFDDINKDMNSRREFLKKLNTELLLIRPFLIFPGLAGVERERAELEKHSMAFQNATDNKSREEAYKQIQIAALAFEASPVCKDIYKLELNKMRENSAKIYKANLVDPSDTNGWAKFRLKLKDSKTASLP